MAGYPVRAGWLGIGENLFGQYQLAGAGDTQTVFLVVVDDHDFVAGPEQ